MKITITDLPGLDGEYTEPIASLTNRELHTIKRISGVRAGEIIEALMAQDNDLVVALAVVVLARAGIDAAASEDVLWDAVAGKVKVDLSEETAEEEDARPPDSPTVNGGENEPGAPASLTAKPESFGDVSANGGGNQEIDLKVTGTPV